MKKSKKIIIAAAGIAVLAAIVIPRILKPKEQIAASSLPVVSLEKPEMGAIELQSALTGVVEPSDIVYIIPKMAGEVTDVYVKAGDMVQEGQPLCKIDTKQVDSAKIALDTAAISLQDANINLDRMRVLFDSGDISKQQFEQVESSAKLAKLQYDSAKLSYDHQVEYSSITAPIGGLIESCNVEIHDNVSQQDVICVVSGEGTKAVSFQVSERVVKGLSVGNLIKIQKNGSDYQGVITEVSTMVDSDTGLFKVKASIDGSDALATGSQVKLYVTSEKAENVITIPTDAVYYEGGQPKVYIYRNQAVHEQPVELGIYSSKKAEVKSGLTLDDNVIVTWSSELFEGSQVELQSNDETQPEEGSTQIKTSEQAVSQNETQEAK